MTPPPPRGPALAVALALTLGGCTLDSFIYHPKPVAGYDFDGIDPNIDGDLTDPHPSIIGPDLRHEGFVDAGGDAIHYIFAERPGANGTIFYSHGNTFHIGRYWDRVERMWAMGYHVMIYDYPGYGRSEGEPDEAGLYASAEAVLAVLPEQPGVDMDRVFFVGYSLGGAPTLHLATQTARTGVMPRAILTESAFCSVQTMVDDGTFLDLPASFVARNPLDNCAKIGQVDAAIEKIVLHGAADDFVRPLHARRLRDRAQPPLDWRLVPGAAHTDIPLVLGDDYERIFWRWFGPPPPGP